MRLGQARSTGSDPSGRGGARRADGTRYVARREVACDRDTEVSWDSFVRRYNADLANDFGNLVNAVTKEAADAAFRRLVDPDAFTIVSAGTFGTKPTG